MNFNLIKRWIRMLLGKSSFHVKQGKGKYYSKYEVKGYYNDMTNKITSSQTLLDDNGIPYNILTSGEVVYFPGTIFQYALGLYDLYLENPNNISYIEQFLKLADWAFDNQEVDGKWKCMSILHNSIHETQSAMCQSEGISVLIRAHIYTNDTKYLEKATNAIELMLKPTNEGGTCYYNNDDIIFQEYVSDFNQSVLNGWIFSLFGIYDYYLYTKNEAIKKVLFKSVETLVRFLPKYDRKFWTNYDLVGTIAIPAYHDIHIMQLLVLYDIFEKKEFIDYAKIWNKYQMSKINKYRAMVIKLIQKIAKSKYYDINTNLVK